MKPPRQFILWYLNGVDQRILHEGAYPGTLALRLAVLTYVGTLDHEPFELGELSARPADDLLPLLLRDEFLAAPLSTLTPEERIVRQVADGRRADVDVDEFPRTIEAFVGDGLFVPVSREDLAARGLDPVLFGSLLVLNRPHFAKLAQEFGSVRRRADELLQGDSAGTAPTPVMFTPPAPPEFLP